jgi:dipeptidyl-peptidase-4
MSDESTSPTESFPRQSARTRRFTAGAPRLFSISADGRRVFYLRSNSGTDAVGRLWCMDVESGAERLIADPTTLHEGDEQLSQEEKARRERMREGNAGIVGYSTDEEFNVATFTLSGELYAVDLGDSGSVRSLPAVGPVIDPRMSPDGSHIAYAAAGALRLIGTDGANDRAVVCGRHENEFAGLVDFAAAEELERSRGFWWSPDSHQLLVERVDETDVAQWWIANPVSPSEPPHMVRYPSAGTANASVSLVLANLDGSLTDVHWDSTAFEYLVDVSWSKGHDPLILVSTRDQKHMQVLSVDAATGATRLEAEWNDAHWIDAAPGATTWLTDGRLLTLRADRETDTYRLHAGDGWLSPAGLQIRDVIGTDDSGVIASVASDPMSNVLVHIGLDGSTSGIGPSTGWIMGRSRAGTTVINERQFDTTQVSYRVERDGIAHQITSHAERPSFTPRVTIIESGPNKVLTAVIFPTDHVPGSSRLPILMSPYGGPHFGQVVAAGASYGEDQWLADQGFAVVIADGRGTPGRGPAWDREIYRDLSTKALEDQVSAVEAVAQMWPDDVDTTRVGIRGWSFGGYLSALAVLRRPDVFHAAVAGAPVTEWRLYDTAYTERYLGNPNEDPAPYDNCSLSHLAGSLSRPLMFIHGLTDDNVVVAHTLALSGALTVAGRPHSVLPLSGVTHMTPQEEVAENKLLLELDFLRNALNP